MTSNYSEDSTLKVRYHTVCLISMPREPSQSGDNHQGEVVSYYNNVTGSLYVTQVGSATANFSYQNTCLFTECTIGDWEADVVRNATNADIGIINSGSIGYC